MKEGVHYSDQGLVDEPEDENDRNWIDLGPDTHSERKQAMDVKMADAIANNISAKGAGVLNNLLNEYCDIIKTRFGRGSPGTGATDAHTAVSRHRTCPLQDKALTSFQALISGALRGKNFYAWDLWCCLSALR